MDHRDRAAMRLSRFAQLRLAAIAVACAAIGVSAPPAWAATTTTRAWRVPGVESSYTTTSGMPSVLLPAGDRFVYLAEASDGALLLWASDGSETGTQVLRELCHRCDLKASASTGTVVFLIVSAGANEPRFWRSDGTSGGTYPLPSSFTGDGSTLYAGSDSAYVLACGSECSLTMTDGTVAGTRQWAGAAFGLPTLFHLQSFVVWNDEAYLLTRDPPAPAKLWRLSARTGRVDRVQDIPGAQCLKAVPSLDRLVIDVLPVDNGGDLWVSDGTTAGTSKLRHFQGLGGCGYVDLGGRAWFLAYDGGGREQIWSTDGTAAGTVRATDLSNASPSTPFAMLGSRFLFFASEGHNNEWRLWTTDGRPEGAQPITDCPGGCLTAAGASAALGDRVAFIGSRANEPPALWITDGTGPGTLKLHEFLRTQYNVTWLTVRGDRWYLSAPKMGEHGYWEGGSDLWASDGTPGGTVAVASIDDVYEARRFESMLVAFEGRVYFPGCVGADCGLLATAGGIAETVRNATVEPDTLLTDVLGRAGRHVLLLDDEGIFWLAGAGGVVALPESLTGAFSTCNAWDLEATATRNRTFVVSSYRCTVSWADNFWSTDGTVAGTRAVALQDSTVATTAPWGRGNNVLYVSVGEEGGGASLGISDGTPRGTKRIAALPAGSYPDGLLTRDGVALFVLYGDSGQQLWSSDGTRSGTRALSSPYYDIGAPVLLGNRAYALALRAYGEARLLLVVDLARLTVEELDLGPLGIDNAGGLIAAAGRLWLAGRAADDAAWSLWVSDGTVPGTRRLPVALLSVAPWALPDLPLITALGGTAYFTSFDPAHGQELWRSDGTEAGTTLVTDLAPGIASGAPQSNVVAWKGRLYFAADDGAHGAELWSSDGTAAGTRLELELGAGAAGSSPAGLTVAGDKLFFLASDGVTGRQVWVMDRTTP